MFLFVSIRLTLAKPRLCWDGHLLPVSDRRTHGSKKLAWLWECFLLNFGCTGVFLVALGLSLVAVCKLSCPLVYAI